MATTIAEVGSQLKESSLEKAKVELNEDPATRNDCISKLKEAILNKEASNDPELEGVVFERKDDPFLLRFLRARKFDQERALKLYMNHYCCRKDYPEIFKDFTPESVKDILQSGAIAVLGGIAKDGTKVLCIQPRYVNPEVTPPWLILRTVLLTLEKQLEDEEVQVNGLRLMINYQDVEFMRVVRISQSEPFKNGVLPKLMQDCMPIRLKGIHLVKQPWYVSIVLTIAKSFMKEKLKKRINLHGYDFPSMHDVFDPNSLPSEFDGPMPAIHTYTAASLFGFEALEPAPIIPITPSDGDPLPEQYMEQDPGLENS